MADFQQGRQVVVDRLKRRLGHYRHNHNSVTSRYDTSIETLYTDQQKQTILLKQRHIESKAKKTNKKNTDNKKQDNSSLLATMGQSKMLARGHDQTTSSGETHENEPAAKKQRLNNGAPPHGGPMHGNPTHGGPPHGGPPHGGPPHGGPIHAGASQSSGATGDINDFQMVQQIPNIKKTDSPVPTGATTSASNGPPVDDVKKEQQDLNDIGLLDDIEDFSNIGDIVDMGINFDQFMSDLDFDNMKQENSNSGLGDFVKEESVENLFDEPNSVSSDSGVASGNANAQSPQVTMSKAGSTSTTSASPVFPQYPGTPPVSHTSTPPTSFTPTSFNPTSTSSTAGSPTQFSATSNVPKIRMNMGQSDMIPAAQTLKQMAEQHQIKMVTTPSNGRPGFGDYQLNNMNNPAGPGMMTQTGSINNQMYNSNMNQTNAMYNNQNSGMSEMEMKKRQLMQQQMAQQQQQHHQQQQQQQQPQQSQQQQPQQQQPQQQQPGAQQQTQMPGGMVPYQNRMSPMGSYPNSSQPGALNPQQYQMAGAMGTGLRGPYPGGPRGPSPIPPGSQAGGPSPMTAGAQLGGQLGADGKMTNEMFYQGQMSGQYALSQAQPPRYPSQQMMGPNSMMRHVNPGGNQLVGQTGQMISRPPPPEYRQVALMQQQQQMMGQPLPQPMSQIGQSMGQISYQGMRPNMRPGMVSGPMVNMGSSQMMGSVTQQTLPPNMPTMKPAMVPTTSMNPSPSMVSSTTMAGASMPTMSVGTMSASNMSNNLGQVSTAGTMGMVSRTPMASGGMLQRPRPPNVNIGPGPGGLNIGTQMPPSRPEWRQIMMQGGQGNMQIIGPMRAGYPQQQPQQGGMMSQGGQIIGMQRPPSQMMNIMAMQQGPSMQGGPGMQGTPGMQPGMQGGPGMQQGPGIQPGPGMQGGPGMQAGPGIQGGPGMQAGPGIQGAGMQGGPTMQGGPRMQANMVALTQQGQVRMGIHMSQAGGMGGAQVTSQYPGQQGPMTTMAQIPPGPNQMMANAAAQARNSAAMAGMTGARSPAAMAQMSGSGHPMSPANRGQMGGASPVNMGQMSGPGQAPSPANMGGMAHPRSPANMGQMHPRSGSSPATMGQGGPARPLSNPGMGQGGPTRPLSNPGMAQQQGQQPAQTTATGATVGGQAPGSTAGPMNRGSPGGMNQSTGGMNQNPGGMNQNPGGMNQTPGSMNQTPGGGPGPRPGQSPMNQVQPIQGSGSGPQANMNMNRVKGGPATVNNGSNAPQTSVANQRPANDGNSSVRTSQPSTPNPPTSSGSATATEFDFEDICQFASLID